MTIDPARFGTDLRLLPAAATFRQAQGPPGQIWPWRPAWTA
jgi:hypothetical protein